MATNKKYDQEFKVQAIKLAKEIGQAKAAKELGSFKNTMYTWTRAQRLGYLDLGGGTQIPQSAMCPHGELCALRAQLKAQEKENRRLKKERVFERSKRFSPPAVSSQQNRTHEIYRAQNYRGHTQREYQALADAMM